jgi:hypothetical protein
MNFNYRKKHIEEFRNLEFPKLKFLNSQSLILGEERVYELQEI